jgi:hypothetical protein
MKYVAHIVPEVAVLELSVAVGGSDEAAHVVPAHAAVLEVAVAAAGE